MEDDQDLDRPYLELFCRRRGEGNKAAEMGDPAGQWRGLGVSDRRLLWGVAPLLPVRGSGC